MQPNEASAPASTWSTRLNYLLLGVVATGSALAISELMAGLFRTAPSLVLTIGQRFIDITPSWLEDWAISTFGTNDKAVLIGGIVVVALIIGGLLGLLARHRPGIASAGFIPFGLVGYFVGITDPQAGVGLTIVTAALATSTGISTLRGLKRLLEAAPAPDSDRSLTPRRAFLAASAGAVVLAAAEVALGRYFKGRSRMALSGRESVVLPTPVESPATTISATTLPSSTTMAPTTVPSSETVPAETTDQAAAAETTIPAETTTTQTTTPETATTQAATTETTAAAETTTTQATASETTTTQAATTETTAAAETTTTQATASETTTTQAAAAETTTTVPETTTTQATVPETTTTVPETTTTVAAQTTDPSDIAGLSTWVTPNSEFYVIDTALSIPQVDLETWRLSFTGEVRNPFSISYEELLAMPMVERYVTLCCVSNPVGGGLVGNAKWLGVPLRNLVDQADVRSGGTQLIGRSVDRFTVGFPTSAVYDGREALLAVGMNGEALPYKHGFPARLVVSGLYGYVSATKWLSEIEFAGWNSFDAYWIPRGWSKEGPIKTQSRIDTPKSGRIQAGPSHIAGVAWAQNRGIEKVEVRVDDEPWREAILPDEVTIDSWRQWFVDHEFTPGSHRIAVRATDSTGRTQTASVQGSRPDGATGYHQILVEAV